MINCVCKDHRDKVKVPDPVMKDLIIIVHRHHACALYYLIFASTFEQNVTIQKCGSNSTKQRGTEIGLAQDRSGESAAWNER